MRVEKFIKALNSDFYTGVPDSLLSPLCNYLMKKYGAGDSHHVIAANEGNAVAIAAGHYMATAKVPVVYLQNSGEGNVVNPIASLCNEKVYGIPMILVIGWRGEPGTKDEPQHKFQGEITLSLLDDLNIPYFVLCKDTDDHEMDNAMNHFRELLYQGKQVAFVVKKGTLSYEEEIEYKNNHTLIREEAIKIITDYSKEDVIVATTGKIGRELFEIRARENAGHYRDFLTVGSMGHCSSIAIGIAMAKRDRRIWVIDGDGAVIMHMGSLAILGSHPELNIVHIVINNEAHESVGGLPTVGKTMDIVNVAKACGYQSAVSVDSKDNLSRALRELVTKKGLALVEIKCAIGSRPDLGRPTTSTKENIHQFMEYLKSE